MNASETNSSWMIYGVNGYTGRLCALEALRRGLRPIVAGRCQERVAPVARELDLVYRVFDLRDPQATVQGLDDVSAVLNCAGPFSATARPFLDACVASKTHYLDVTGETDIFEYVHQHGDRWEKAGIVAMPGVGFDVVPTDCMAAMLKEALPSATHLRLAFKSRHGKMSPGTTKTMIEGLSQGSMVRRNGVLAHTDTGSVTAMIPFTDGPALSTAIPWGDVSTAFYSTGIPNIEVYTVVPESQARWLPWVNRFSFIFKSTWVQGFLKRQVDRKVTGPDAAEREGDVVELYGDVQDSQGQRSAVSLRTPNGYTLTCDAAVTSMERLLSDASLKPGALTPSMAFGSAFVLELAGVHRMAPRT